MNTPRPGHNDQLRSIVERIEAINNQIKEWQVDRSDIFKEAGSQGYDVPALKAIIRARREDEEKRQAREAQEQVYREVLGIE